MGVQEDIYEGAEKSCLD